MGKDKCFVLMPFHNPFNTYYEQILKPAITKSGMVPLRADEIYGVDPIMSDIWNSINLSKVLIADLTTRNPNVFYELGLSHAIRKPVVLISQSIEDIPFDLRALRILIYKTENPNWATELENKITQTLNEILTKPETANEILPKTGFNTLALKGNILKSLSNLLTEEEFRNEESLYWKGYFLMDFEDYEEAISCFEKSILKNPADDAALYQIACCYAKLEKKDKMLQYLKRAINIDRENANEALHDDDFSKYKDDKDFKTLVFFEHSA